MIATAQTYIQHNKNDIMQWSYTNANNKNNENKGNKARRATVQQMTMTSCKQKCVKLHCKTTMPTTTINDNDVMQT